MLLEILLQRLWFTEHSTCGEISINDKIEFYTLELPVKDGLPGSAIPPGRYKVTIEPSPKFKASTDPWVMRFANLIPHVNGIPDRSHILIHWGNTAQDTEGCILVGMTHRDDSIGFSRQAFEKLHALIVDAALAEECWLKVQGGLPMYKEKP